jgi:homoserine kinase type II
MTEEYLIEESDFRKILQSFALGEYLNFDTFANGAGQTIVLLETTIGKYVLRYFKSRDRQHAVFEAELSEYLSSNGYPVPSLIKSIDGSQVNEYQGKPYILLEFVEGHQPLDPNEYFDAEQASKVIAKIAYRHNLTKNKPADQFTGQTPHDFNYCMTAYDNQERKINTDSRKLWFTTEMQALNLSDNLPKGICHADVNYGNFLFRNGEVVAVLDFDRSFHTHLIYDLANLIYWWASPPSKGLQIDTARYIVSEYSKHRKITAQEQESIFDALKFLHLLGIATSDEDEFQSGYDAIKELEEIGRNTFYQNLFQLHRD